MVSKFYKNAREYFSRVAALNELIDKGGVEAKDAVIAKMRLVNLPAAKTTKSTKKKSKRKKTDLLDSRAMLPGSYGSTKRR